MKKINSYIIAALSIFLLTQCNEDGDLITLDTENGVFEAPSLTNTASANGGVLTGENVKEVFEVFEWSTAVFDGLNIATDYTGQIASADDFSDAITLFTTTASSYSVTKGDINSAMLALGLPANAESTFYIRIVAKANATGLDELAQLVSGGISRTATSFVAIADPLYFVGPGSAAGWNEAGTFGVLFPSVANAKLHNYRGYFAADEWKLIAIPGSWAEQWGPADGQPQNANGTAALSGNARAWNMAAGYYDFSLNIATGAYTIASFDASGATDYTSLGIGLTGDAVGGWDDVPPIILVQSTFDPHIWSKTGVTFTAANFKIKQAQAGWGVQWGVPSTADTNWPYGKANGGSDMAAKAGTYTVWFNDLTGDYFMLEE